MPRFVISSPIHISSVVPAVSVSDDQHETDRCSRASVAVALEQKRVTRATALLRAPTVR